ncbi:Bax inhibitor-1/YccA family protein [Lactobacillus jensenii]|uniref:Bax inhibitor-1/YccA family protein n=1 Tax=Lactobacillus jensenii TaxID=109790 RepID=UPI001F35C622|nr:Bax inhibitor-1/YccA family protein [Lactobacillus jensenii]MCF1777891.1 Bax inhibitor-1/YccA family protein [Lactobacillus jensenii]
MDYFSQDSGRRKIQDVTAINSFLTKMYGFMLIAVLVSAVSSYLTMTVFRSAIMNMPQAMFWVIIFLPFALCLGISFKAAKNPTLGFTLLMFLSVVYGVEFSIIASYYTGTTITSAFLSAAGVFAAMALFGTFTKKDLSSWGSYLRAAMIGFIVATLVNIFFVKSGAGAYIFSYIGVLIFTGWTAYDANSAKRIFIEYGNQVSDSGLAIMGALNMYLDFINLFMLLLEIFGVNDRR